MHQDPRRGRGRDRRCKRVWGDCAYPGHLRGLTGLHQIILTSGADAFNHKDERSRGAFLAARHYGTTVGGGGEVLEVFKQHLSTERAK